MDLKVLLVILSKLKKKLLKVSIIDTLETFML